MERGTQLEPKARAAYEIIYDADMPAVVMIHDKHECIRASFDGHNREISRDLEIKCPGEKDHETALAGSVPEKYIPQIQHLLMVSGSSELHYYSYHPDFPQGKRGKVVVVKPDPMYQKELLERELAFWECVQTDSPPELTEKDFKELKDEESVALFAELKKAKAMQDQAVSLYDSIKKKIIEKVQLARVRCSGVQMIRTTRKGSVDYSKVPELKGVDLERYRKKHSDVIEFRLLKGEV